MIDIKQLEKQFKYLKINNSETSIHTPFKLVEEMLDKLPINWSDKNLKFADIVCGRGTFLVCIYNRLYSSLKSIIIDDQERKNHILNNMIYGVDINSINTRITKKSLPSKNIICADSLEYKFNMKFDVIIGNPPYQPPTKSKIQKMGSGLKIWHKFIEKAFQVTHEKSIISMVTPSHWRLGNFSNSQISQAQELMFNCEIVTIKKVESNVFSGTAGHISIDYWILNRKNKPKNNIFYKKRYLSLNDSGNILENYFNAIDTLECYIQDFMGTRNRKNDHIEKSKFEDGIYKYRAINTYSQYKEGFFDWYKEKLNDYNEKKVIITNSVRLSASDNKLAIYDNGTMSLSAGGIGYSVKTEEEGKKLCNFLNNSKIIKLLCYDKIGHFGYAIPVQTLYNIPKSFVERFNNGEDL